MHFNLSSEIINQDRFDIFFLYIFCFLLLLSFSSSGKRDTARWIDWFHSLPTSLRRRDPECKHASQVRGHFTFRDRAKKWRLDYDIAGARQMQIGCPHRATKRMVLSRCTRWIGWRKELVEKRDRNRFAHAQTRHGRTHCNSLKIGKRVSWTMKYEWAYRGLIVTRS